MKILVTGSSGTIGTRLCERLLERGDSVLGMDWMENKWQKNVEVITTRIDLRDEKAVEAVKVPDGVETLVHLAANARVYELVEHPERARDNFLTLFNTLELARKHGIKRFVFASSRESYGNIRADLYKEDMVRVENCESPYTASKVGGEALVEAYRRCYGIDQITFRFSNVYGMYDDTIRVVPLFIRQARANQPMAVFGKDKCLDFTYIDDTVSGIIAALEKFDAIKNQTYNLAYGEGTTILHLAERVKELCESTSEIAVGPSRTGEVVRYVADIAKAKKAFGYSPQTPFEKGIKLAADWYRKHT